MRYIYSPGEYETLVADIGNEYCAQVQAGRAKELADAAIVDYVDHARTGITVTESARVFGEPLHVLDREQLSPYDVIRYSEQYPSTLLKHQDPSATELAKEMLVMDLIDECGYHESMQYHNKHGK